MVFNFLKKISLRKRFKRLKWAIVIDPGHGGRDPGAVSKTYGYMEKFINLHVANFMEKYIDEHVLKMTTVMTRGKDCPFFVSLPDRCELANSLVFNFNRKHADVFISIHTNARPLKGRYGLEIETYYFRGSEEGEDLAYCIQNTLFNRSMAFGVPVIDRGVKIGQRRGKDGELKDFYVLRETDMPAVLVELGFLSDDEEAQLLINPANQEVMAKAIVDGVVQYLEARDG